MAYQDQVGVVAADFHEPGEVNDALEPDWAIFLANAHVTVTILLRKQQSPKTVNDFLRKFFEQDSP